MSTAVPPYVSSQHSEKIQIRKVKIRREYRWVDTIDYHGHIVNQVEYDVTVKTPSGKIKKSVLYS